jgi:heat shock protein HtpX
MLLAMVIFHFACAFFGVNPDAAFGRSGIDIKAVGIFSLVFGMTGSFISLLLSKHIAKFSVGAVTIDGSEGDTERWLVDTVRSLADRANIAMPEVAIYEGSPNAFATGAFKNKSLVAVSTGIIRSMTREELRAVIGHEISHVSNGDMVTMTLLQGVLNACVIFLSNVLAHIASSSGDGSSRRGSSFKYYIVYYTLQCVLGLLATILVLWYSRRREFAADRGSANLLGSTGPMIAALRKLGNLTSEELPNSMKTFAISGPRKTSIFATHPALEDRIESLQSYTPQY